MRRQCRWLRRKLLFTCKLCLWIWVLLLLAALIFAHKDRAFRSRLRELHDSGLKAIRDRLDPKQFELRQPPDAAPKKVSPTLTLFTSFREEDDSRAPLHTLTIKNWASLKPFVRPVVFCTNPTHRLNRLASDHGWNLHPIPRVNSYDTPYLKDMYLTAYNLYDTDFYAYANGDLLFTQNFIPSLKAVLSFFSRHDDLGPPFIIGRRSNLALADFTQVDKNLYKPDVVHQQKVQPFHNFAMDYFVTARSLFPWSKMLDVVIGRGGYDQYLVLTAIVNGMTVVDASNTNKVLHLQGKSFNLTSRTADNADRTFNLDTIRSVHWGHLPPTGNVALAKAYTHRKNDEIIVSMKKAVQYRDEYKKIDLWAKNDTYLKRIGQQSFVFRGYSKYS